MSVFKRILIVDDDERVLFVLQHTLMRMNNGYEVVTCRSGHEVLDQCKERPFDLVVTDLRMQDMNGIELTEAIKALDSGAAVIWITAYGCYKVRDEAARLAVCACLDKPLEIAEIRQAVREALETTESQNLRMRGQKERGRSTSSSTKNT
jgi:DNA-binding NtrC family response regulator